MLAKVRSGSMGGPRDSERQRAIRRNQKKGHWEPTQLVEHLGLEMDLQEAYFRVIPARPQTTNDKYTLLRAKGPASDNSLLLRSQAHKYLQTSFNKPAAELEAVLQKHKQFKAVKVSSSADAGLPSTAKGCIVDKLVIDKLRAHVEEQAAQVQKKKQNEESRSRKDKQKTVDEYLAHNKKISALKEAADGGTLVDAIKKMTVPNLK
ncbi:hypothetical protein CYMTET_46485 [Cymbomonas tetramitiformis]|uniref:Uncharacterized protein n=1 Tax=Cymbomonas tetramitiformis TaxID=36881 RepID=A0AAE0BW39_9CHLO|nr:hypothetical protein CYMTET_46485 [Cymbomonas tetramitiformis]